MSELIAAGVRTSDLLSPYASAYDVADPRVEHIAMAARPIFDNYRYLPIQESFDWPGILDSVEEHFGIGTDQLYLVCFRSARRPDADGATIELLDEGAYQEARASGELLNYFADSVDHNGVALSWCLWRDKDIAQQTLAGSAHGQAKRRVNEFYDEWNVEQFDLLLTEDRQIIFQTITAAHSPHHPTA